MGCQPALYKVLSDYSKNVGEGWYEGADSQRTLNNNLHQLNISSEAEIFRKTSRLICAHSAEGCSILYH